MAITRQLDQILLKTQQLLELSSALQEENDLLKLENQSLKDRMDDANARNVDLEEKLRALKMARSLEAMSGINSGINEKTLDIKQKISEFVREIDKCIVLLKK